MTNLLFQPFTDRLSRDIRNDLSRSLIKVLHSRSMASALEVADRYLAMLPGPCYAEYIAARVCGYARALEKINTGPADPLWRALVLWDNYLFFEVHEILEHAWLKAEGNKKLLLQAMIRAAGVYIKLESGYTETAEKMAAKAIPVIRENRHHLDVYTNPDRLLQALNSLAPPPRLLP